MGEREQICPHCGQPIPAPMRSASRLRTLLAKTNPRGEPLYAYRCADGGGWAVTHTAGERFGEALVLELVRAGELAPVYPGLSGEREAYGRASYFASPGYLNDLAEKIARVELRRRGRK